MPLMILPILTSLLFYVILQKKVDQTQGVSRRNHLCEAGVVLITELLSIPRLVRSSGLALLGSLLPSLIVYLKASELKSIRIARRDVVEPVENGLDRTTVVLLGMAAIIVVLVEIAVLIAPPGNIDVMAYTCAECEQSARFPEGVRRRWTTVIVRYVERELRIRGADAEP